MSIWGGSLCYSLYSYPCLRFSIIKIFLTLFVIFSSHPPSLHPNLSSFGIWSIILHFLQCQVPLIFVCDIYEFILPLRVQAHFYSCWGKGQVRVFNQYLGSLHAPRYLFWAQRWNDVTILLFLAFQHIAWPPVRSSRPGSARWGSWSQSVDSLTHTNTGFLF